LSVGLFLRLAQNTADTVDEAGSGQVPLEAASDGNHCDTTTKERPILCHLYRVLRPAAVLSRER